MEAPATHRRNYLKNLQVHKLYSWLQAHSAEAADTPTDGLAETATQQLGFTVTGANIVGAAAELHIPLHNEPDPSPKQLATAIGILEARHRTQAKALISLLELYRQNLCNLYQALSLDPPEDLDEPIAL